MFYSDVMLSYLYVLKIAHLFAMFYFFMHYSKIIEISLKYYIQKYCTTSTMLKYYPTFFSSIGFLKINI